MSLITVNMASILTANVRRVNRERRDGFCIASPKVIAFHICKENFGVFNKTSVLLEKHIKLCQNKQKT